MPQEIWTNTDGRPHMVMREATYARVRQAVLDWSSNHPREGKMWLESRQGISPLTVICGHPVGRMPLRWRGRPKLPSTWGDGHRPRLLGVSTIVVKKACEICQLY